jgi:hypothetical protein
MREADEKNKADEEKRRDAEIVISQRRNTPEAIARREETIKEHAKTQRRLAELQAQKQEEAQRQQEARRQEAERRQQEARKTECKGFGCSIMGGRKRTSLKKRKRISVKKRKRISVKKRKRTSVKKRKRTSVKMP